MEAWYVLYEGHSEDGRGDPHYAGRTTDPRKAMQHYRDKIHAGKPYTTGRVDRIFDTYIQYSMTLDELRKDVGEVNEAHSKAKQPKPAGYGAFA